MNRVMASARVDLSFLVTSGRNLRPVRVSTRKRSCSRRAEVAVSPSGVVGSFVTSVIRFFMPVRLSTLRLAILVRSLGGTILVGRLGSLR